VGTEIFWKKKKKTNGHWAIWRFCACWIDFSVLNSGFVGDETGWVLSFWIFCSRLNGC